MRRHFLFLERHSQGQSRSKAEMHRPIMKMKTSAGGNAEDVDSGAAGSMIAPTETKSVASNSLSASTGSCYEVFLSFRGPDTRKGFSDHLYHGLLDAGIYAFRDDDELCEGENIRPELLAAIRNSKILIPILSVTYGTSSWCLDELVQIMDCKNNKGHIVLPIFYKVKPAEVGCQIGSFGEAFHERERRLLERHFNPTILEKWKQALLEISKLKGYEADGYEAELVKSVVRKVLTELKKSFELVISENLVGIDCHVNKVMEFVDNKSNATLFVGIHGMGGIGKTTLAKTIYNKLSNQFEHHSFIADIRESWKCNGVHYLQNQLIYHIFNRKNEVCNADAGTKFISSMFKSKKVLVLLDDVDDVVQLQSLAGNRDWFSLGSKIIITTRNKRVLEEVGVDHDYEHKEMDYNQSLILFSKHAFRRDSPPREFEDLTHEAVSITGGLPLSLEVFGSLLCGKESRQWRDTIKKLKKVPPKKVQEKLRISYEALDYGQKQIFLDIACLFIGTNDIIASYMWDACDFYPGEGIEVLIFMSLIKVGDDHKLRMHDQLRDLGREIVREEDQRKPSCRSRLWDHEEAQKVLKENKGTDKIEAINLSKRSAEGFNEMFPLEKDEGDGDIYTEKQFKNLTNLRYLHMINAHLKGDFKDLMKGLKWLQWQKCPASQVNTLDAKELAVLELQGSMINEKWEGWSSFKMAEKLKYLDLSNCQRLEDTDFLSAFKKLEVLILQSCHNLKRIDTSIGDMEALLRLEVWFCHRFTELPAEIGKSKTLQQLILQENGSLSALPDSIGSLENLEILDIHHTNIKELPNIGSLTNLQKLFAGNCSNLKGIMAETMSNFSSLRHLDFGHCPSLQSLPDLPSGLTHLGVTCQSCKLASLSHLPHLKELVVWDVDDFYRHELQSTQLKSSECSQLTDVEESESPQSLNTPFELEFLRVECCRSIETLDVSESIHLGTLDVRDCHNLFEVRGLDKSIYLEYLRVFNCHPIKRLDLPKSECLKNLVVSKCEKLAEIQGLDGLEYLESLYIECTSMERLSIPKSGRLKELSAQDCENLAEIQGLDGLEYLKSLYILWCTSMKRLSLPKSGRLKNLNAHGCKKLAEIQDRNGLEYLESLDISKCTSMERLFLPKSGRLKKLNAYGCKNLAEIQGLDGLEYLKSLDISKCTSMERLFLPKSKSLKILKATSCANLVEIQGLNGLEYLESLEISGCTSMERLSLPKSESLEILQVRDCANLVEIQSLDGLEYLKSLEISECTSMERLSLPKSKSLEILQARDCTNLVEIQGLDGLEYLKSLEISWCTSMERLSIPKSKSLEILKARDCTNLVEIQGLDRLKLQELNIIGCKALKTILESSGT